LAAAVALAANARVRVVDYRLAPETPFPGAFDDCLHAYHWLVAHGGADPQTLAVLGDSAGGNLAVAVTAAASDQGLALPARIALISPLATRIRTAATTAGVDVAFESWRHGIHVWPVFISAGLPESAAAIEHLATFFKTPAVARSASETSR
jgi:acetyl esterase/lipase